jgi:hypothetical protein
MLRSQSAKVAVVATAADAFNDSGQVHNLTENKSSQFHAIHRFDTPLPSELAESELFHIDSEKEVKHKKSINRFKLNKTLLSKSITPEERDKLLKQNQRQMKVNIFLAAKTITLHDDVVKAQEFVHKQVNSHIMTTKHGTWTDGELTPSFLRELKQKARNMFITNKNKNKYKIYTE